MPTIDVFAVGLEAKAVNLLAQMAMDLIAATLEVSFTDDVAVLQEIVDDGAAQLRRRVDMMADMYAWQNYQLGKVEGSEEKAASQGRRAKYAWVLDAGAQHCSTCLTLAAGGPYTLDELPGIPGDAPTDCNGGCRCDLVEVGA